MKIKNYKFELMALTGTALTLAGTLLGQKVSDKKTEDAINKKCEELFEQYTATKDTVKED